MYLVARDFYQWIEQQKIKRIGDTIIRRSKHGNASAELFIPQQFNGRTILAVHGTGNDRVFGLSRIFQQLLAAGFALFTFDIDGHGAQSSTLLVPDEMTTCVVDAYEMLQSLLQREQMTSEVCALGHSLGGLLLGHATTAFHLPFHALSFISVPRSLKIDLSVVLAELGSLGSPGFWNLLRRYGISEGMPALGSFRRHTFPVRLLEAKSDYVSEIVRIINELGPSLDPKQLPCPSQWIFGAFDRIASWQLWQEKFSGVERLEVKILPKDNHFTTLLTDVTGQHIVRFMQT